MLFYCRKGLACVLLESCKIDEPSQQIRNPSVPVLKGKLLYSIGTLNVCPGFAALSFCLSEQKANMHDFRELSPVEPGSPHSADCSHIPYPAATWFLRFDLETPEHISEQSVSEFCPLGEL